MKANEELALKCIELTTGLKYKSKQSLRYLEQAKSQLKKKKLIINKKI